MNLWPTSCPCVKLTLMPRVLANIRIMMLYSFVLYLLSALNKMILMSELVNHWMLIRHC
ncbi:hypothetical protein HOLleu_43809 [Holothuria leucospilota]|uniref:Uncharacterized protein n=1 Tax=Holothuria leucospilota TaxID=206669 RepID=A0A9Q0YB60_HOLLE|nr:hypothetical protein HOLleu_43809 [Holothuria leucospilota]